MLKKITQSVAVCLAVLFMTACSITSPLTATSNPVGKKIGTAKAKIIFGMVFGGDYSVMTAAKNGGITKIATVDVKTFNALGIFISKKVIVSGE